MEIGVTKRDIDRARKNYIKFDKSIEPDQLIRKNIFYSFKFQRPLII
jgi:hypothetical protein